MGKNVREYDYRPAGCQITSFGISEDGAWLSRLYGMECGFCGRDAAFPRTRGLVLLDSSLGRLECSDMQLTESRFDLGTVRLAWADASQSLCYQSDWTFCNDTGCCSRKDRVVNTGKTPVTVFRSLARFVFTNGAYEMYSQVGRWSNENQGVWQRITHGVCVLTCVGGRTCQGATPYLALRPQGEPRGVAFHLLPQGNWVIRVSAHTGDGRAQPFVVVEMGQGDENLTRQLAPGETLEHPEVLIQSVPEGRPHLAAPTLHKYSNFHYFQDAQKPAPVVYNTWFDRFTELHVPRMHQQLAVAKEIGCEVFTVDDGWYGAAGQERGSAAIGDWREKPDAAFFGHMKEFSDEVRAAGLGFGLWMEPERIHQFAPTYQAHPEWFLPGNFGCYPNLQNPKAYNYLLGEMSRLIETYQLAWLKNDFNADFRADRYRMEFHGYYAGWRRMMDELRRKYPSTFFEGCASGGMRLELSSLRYCDGHLLTDAVEPIDLIRIYQGALLRLPPGRLAKWTVLNSVNDPPVYAGARRRTAWDLAVKANVDFAARACLPGMLGISGGISELTPEARKCLAQHIAFYKRWREYMLGAVCHLLTQPAPREDCTGWTALQLTHPNDKRSILFAYRLDDANDQKYFRPRGLCPQTLYEVADEDEPDSKSAMQGSELAEKGLLVKMPSRNMARVIVLSPAQ